MSTLAAIADGRVDVVYRRWTYPRVQSGTALRTPIGIVTVGDVTPTPLRTITSADASRAGYRSRSALLTELARHEGRTYRIAVRHAGADPRVAIRGRGTLSQAERGPLLTTVERLGARSADGPWGVPILRLIHRHPAVRSFDLATQLGMDARRFKTRVRQLKELGLTESLEIGYRLSPRGRSLLDHVATPR